MIDFGARFIRCLGSREPLSHGGVAARRGIDSSRIGKIGETGKFWNGFFKQRQLVAVGDYSRSFNERS
jgi:hypothetical protein